MFLYNKRDTINYKYYKLDQVTVERDNVFIKDHFDPQKSNKTDIEKLKYD